MAAAFSRKVRLASITSGLAAGKSSIARWVAASEVMGMGLCGSPVEWAPNSSRTVGRTHPELISVAGISGW